MNEVVEVPNSSDAWGTTLDLQPANGNANQFWYFQPAGTVSQGGSVTTEYRIINKNSNDCMEAAGADPQDGATVDQYGCDPNAINQPNQLWLPTVVNPEDPSIVSLYNLATLKLLPDGEPDGLNWPMLTESSNISPGSGSTMTVMSFNAQDADGLYPSDSVWTLSQISTSGSGSSGSSTPACSMFSCLLG
jgi:Ricin-type beta-trefoil lectin domain-like